MRGRYSGMERTTKVAMLADDTTQEVQAHHLRLGLNTTTARSGTTRKVDVDADAVP